MRGKWNHEAPAETQPWPPDNTSDHVMAQVARWADKEIGSAFFGGVLIHPEVAMEIASWWHSPSSLDAGITAFSHTGTVTDSLIPELERELANVVDNWVPTDQREDNAMALRALLAYVKAVRS